MLNLLASRLRLRPLHRMNAAGVDDATLDVHLTSTQAIVRDALAAALRDGAACIVLTSAAGLGKTTVLTAALARVSDLTQQILRLDDAGSGLEDAFQMLFAPIQQWPRWRQPRARRIIVVMDHAETMPPETFAYLELLMQMPGREAAVQWVIAGQLPSWNSVEDSAARWLREMSPVRLTLPPLSERDAWELFQYRVVSGYGVRSGPRLVAALLQQSEGLPGRFDAAVLMAVSAGLLKGAPAHTVE